MFVGFDMCTRLFDFLALFLLTNMDKVNMLVINKHFGQAKPDYKALTNRRGKWTVEVTPEG